jgi:hypothetical protein
MKLAADDDASVLQAGNERFVQAEDFANHV